jgi:hypothetical protein
VPLWQAAGTQVSFTHTAALAQIFPAQLWATHWPPTQTSPGWHSTPTHTALSQLPATQMFPSAPRSEAPHDWSTHTPFAQRRSPGQMTPTHAAGVHAPPTHTSPAPHAALPQLTG